MLGSAMKPEGTPKDMQLLLDVWREACHHIEIGEFVARIAPRLAQRIPFRMMAVRRVELDHLRLETLATGPGVAPALAAPRARTDGTAQELEQVAAWCRGNKCLQAGPGERTQLLRLLCPPDIELPVLAGPLSSGEELGVLLFFGAQPFQKEHAETAAQLLEAFAAALENDHRFHELERLREAALADNQALLSRLGRQDISESIVGAESGLRNVMQRVEKVAATDAPVLILGETGSGKEVIARAIHTRSPRFAGPIVRVNCGAIPTELVDSELFGHEKGSFTGAIATHHGVFERADGGTLFLDEIGELTPAAQVRLLRILQDGTFERVGGQQTRTVDVRIVAATHRDLEDMVAEGTFRQDLWYRISVFPIHLPPLRERPADIPHLAAHFAASAGKRLGGAPLQVSQEDMVLLVAYSWPGNVRELAAVIERAAILGDGKHLDVGTALGQASSGGPRRPAAALAAGAAPEKLGPDSLDSAMRRHIEEALTATRGRIEGSQGAARMLGINPHTLRARMRKLGIDWQRYRQVESR
jgi:transcriptional regulator with GAF, ATPase, and Fis domain